MSVYPPFKVKSIRHLNSLTDFCCRHAIGFEYLPNSHSLYVRPVVVDDYYELLKIFNNYGLCESHPN